MLINKQRKSIKYRVLFFLTGKLSFFLTQGYFSIGDFEIRKDFVNFLQSLGTFDFMFQLKK